MKVNTFSYQIFYLDIVCIVKEIQIILKDLLKIRLCFFVFK